MISPRPERGGRGRLPSRGLIVALALLATLPGAASAERLDKVVAVADEPHVFHGKRYLVNVHGHAPSAATRAEMASDATGREPLPIPAAAPPGLDPRPDFCGTPRTTDDVADEASGLSRVKVVYAYPEDGVNRFAQYADEIARTVYATTVNYRNQLGRGLRFDYGTDAGHDCLDIQTMRLPRTRAEYLAPGWPSHDAARFDRLIADVNAVVSSQGAPAATSDYLIYADDLYVDSADMAFAESERAADDSFGGAIHQNGNLHSIIWGGGATHFVGSGATAEWYERYTVMHELGHVLGAVQDSAPHATGAAHCNDFYDVMCYDDGGPQSLPAIVCRNANEPQGPLQWDARPLDCNRDDYANPSPRADSYLATHWNIMRSAFVCDVCLKQVARPAAALAITPAGEPRTGDVITLDAGQSTDPDGTILQYSFDTDGDGRVDVSSTAPTTTVIVATPRVLAPSVTVKDDDGLSASASTSLPIRSHTPVAALGSASSVVAGRIATLDATHSSDADGDPLQYAWDLDGNGSYETPGGTSGSYQWTAPTATGTRSLGVRVMDPYGEAATTVTHIAVVARGAVSAPSAAAIATVARPAAATLALEHPARLSGGKLTVRLRCTCSGWVRVVAAGVRSPRRRFSLRGARRVHLALPAAMRARLARRGSLRVTVRGGFVDSTTKSETLRSASATLRRVNR